MARKRGLKVEAFAIGFGPKIFGWRKDGIDYSWRWIPAGGFVRIPQMITSEALEGKQGAELPPAPPFSKILVAAAGPFMNIVFAFVIASVLYFTGLPVLIDPSVVGYVDPNSPEGKMGIQEGDRIVMVDGKPTKSWQDVQEATIFATVNPVPVVIERDGVRNQYQLEAKPSPLLGGKYLNLESKDHPVIGKVMEGGAAEEAGIKSKDLVVEFAGVKIAGIRQFTKLVNERAGKPTEIVVKRNNERVALNVTPRGPEGQGLIRVSFDSVKNFYEVQKPGPAPWTSIGNIVDKTFKTLNAVFFRSKETGVGPSDLAGPIGIFTMLAHQVSVDYRLALSFLLLLNVNLAVLNLLPLPVLDGGHIIMSIIESIIRRPLPVKIQEYATTVFAVLLISFMLFVSFHDVKRIKSGLFKALFEQENQIGGEPPKELVAPQNTTPAPAN
jgi:regulator of sigma E protease